MNKLIMLTPYLGIIVFLILIWWDSEKQKHITIADIIFSFTKVIIVCGMLVGLIAVVILTAKWILNY